MSRIAPTSTGYDYSALPADLAQDAAAVAERVRQRHGQTVAAILEMGRDLLGVKERLPHGQFGPWLQAEFGGVARTAQNYMRAAELFAEKSEMVSHLPPTTLYALAAPSVSPAVRAEVIGQLDQGNRPTQEQVDGLLVVDRDKRSRERLAVLSAQRGKRSAAARKEAGDKARVKFEREERERQRADAEHRARVLVAASIAKQKLGRDLPRFVQALESALDDWGDRTARILVDALRADGEPPAEQPEPGRLI